MEVGPGGESSTRAADASALRRAWSSRSRWPSRCAIVLDPVVGVVVGALGCALLVAVSVIDLEPRRDPEPHRRAGSRGRAGRPHGARSEPALGGRRAARGRDAVRARGDSPGRARHGGREARGIPRRLARLERRARSRCWARSAAFVPAVGLIIMRGRAARKVALPFAPFLAFGGVIALLAGHDIVDWYRSLGA